MSRPFEKLTGKAEACIRMEARGTDHMLILKEIFGLDPDGDPKEINRANQQMYRWRHHPAADAIWDSEVKAIVKQCVPKAVNRIRNQIEDDNGWLANKAANDVVNLAKTTGIFVDDSKAINVQITGMPDIGSPDQDDG